jgi:hypothetical protein
MAGAGDVPLGRLWTGAPCSHQRTWAEKDGAPRISYHGAPPTTACAAFIKESRMKFGTPTSSTGNPGEAPSNALVEIVLDLQGNSPKTATLFVVPTYTLPLAIMGATNLLSVKVSRLLGAWVLSYNSVGMFVVL